MTNEDTGRHKSVHRPNGIEFDSKARLRGVYDSLRLGEDATTEVRVL